MKCLYCQKEIPSNIDYCPYCRKQVPHDNKKNIIKIVIAGVIVTVIAVTIYFAFKNNEKHFGIDESPIESSIVDNSIFDNIKEESISSEQLSSSLSAEPEKEKLDVTSVKWMQTDQINESEMWYYSADTGHIFIILFIELENNTTNAQKFSIIDFEAYADDFKEKFVTFSSDLVINGYSPLIYYSFDEVEVKPNRKQAGYLAIEVKQNWQEVEFIYNGDDDNTFVIKNN